MSDISPILIDDRCKKTAQVTSFLIQAGDGEVVSLVPVNPCIPYSFSEVLKKSTSLPTTNILCFFFTQFEKNLPGKFLTENMKLKLQKEKTNLCF